MNNYEQTRNVLVAVDVQNDFISGSLPVSEGEQVVEPMNEVATAVRGSGGNVAFTRDWHPINTRHFDNWPEHCVRHTEGAEFHPDLEIMPEDNIISKGTGRLENGYSGWQAKDEEGVTLEAIITPHDPKEKVSVFIGGLATDYCVRATALDIAKHFEDDDRVKLHLLRDAIRAVGIDPSAEEEALEAMEAAKIVAISSHDARVMIEGLA